MPKRKLNNVTQRKDGRWVARKTFGYNPDGKPNRKVFYGCTAAEAAQKLADYERQLENDLNVDADNITFEKWLAVWLRGMGVFFAPCKWYESPILWEE